MKDISFFINSEVKHFLDEKGELKNSDFENSINNAIKIGKRLLGGTLITNSKVFIISMVELYYGSISDECHDWYKVFYSNSHRGISANQVEIQNERGLRFYSKHLRNSNWNRIDIVIGDEGVAVSFLIRNLIDMNGNSVAKYHGGPGIVARELFSQQLIDNPEIQIVNTDNPSFKNMNAFIDTHDLFADCNNNPLVHTNRRCRNNQFLGLTGKYQERKWNLSYFQKSPYCVPKEIKALSTFHLSVSSTPV